MKLLMPISNFVNIANLAKIYKTLGSAPKNALLNYLANCYP